MALEGHLAEHPPATILCWNRISKKTLDHKPKYRNRTVPGAEVLWCLTYGRDGAS